LVAVLEETTIPSWLKKKIPPIPPLRSPLLYVNLRLASNRLWQTQPYAARIAALEEIRRAYIAWKYVADAGFQRVCTIIKR
jgi:hypothetical protein